MRNDETDRRRLMGNCDRLLKGCTEAHPYGDGWLEPCRNAWSQLGLATEVTAA